MSPVLGYARPTRFERTRSNSVTMQRAESPQSQHSGGSMSSNQFSPQKRASVSSTTNIFSRFAVWSRGGGTSDSTSEDSDVPSQVQSQGESASIGVSNVMSGPAEPQNSSVNIEDYCFGKPRKIGQSHAGGVELFMCLHEDAIFLPTVKRSHRRRRHRDRSRRHEDRNRRNAAPMFESSEIRPAAASSESFTPEMRSETSIFDTLGQRRESTGADLDSSEPESADPDAALDLEQGVDAEAVEPYFEEEAPEISRQASHTGSVSTNFSANMSDTDSVAPPTQNLDLHSGGVIDESDAQSSPTSTLRGSVLLKLSKPTKIKEIGVDFHCVSRTLWNLLSQTSVLADSTLPNNAQVEDSAYLGIHHWDFVPLEQFGSAQAQYDKASGKQSATLIGQDLYGADVAILKDQPNVLQQRKYSRVYNSESSRVRGQSSHLVPVFGPLKAQPRKIKPGTVQADGVMFPAGSYVYNFTLLIDAKTPGSVTVPNGEVKFVLGARVVRAGPFNMNVNGHIEVDVVRAPPDATADGAVYGPLNDAVLLSRVWDDRFVYSVSIDRRSMTLDVPTKVSINLLPLSDPDVRLHQIQVFAMETVTYVYSLDPSIRYVDPDLKLLLFQKDADEGKITGNLLHGSDTTVVDADITLVSAHNKAPKKAAIQPYMKGRHGENRYIEPDVKGPFVTVKHRLMVVMRVSRSSDVDDSRCFYEVKVDTPIVVQSRHCAPANIRLPLYTQNDEIQTDLASSDHMGANGSASNDGQPPPSFADAMDHRLLGPSGAASMNRNGIKADFRPS